MDLFEEGFVNDQSGLAGGQFHNALVQLRTVEYLIANALTLLVDQYTADKGLGRIDEAPGGNAVNQVGVGVYPLAQFDAATVAANGAQGDAIEIFGCLRARHIAIKIEAATADDDCLVCVDAYGICVVFLQASRGGLQIEKRQLTVYATAL